MRFFSITMLIFSILGFSSAFAQKLEDVPMNPETLRLMECMGTKLQDNKQPPIPSPTPKECEALLGEEQTISGNERLAEYLDEMTAGTNSVYRAQLAGMCGLRSDSWFMSIRNGYLQFKDAEAKRLNLSPQQLAIANKRLAAMPPPQMSFGPNGTCAKLMNSPIMDKLDQLQWRITGGYH